MRRCRKTQKDMDRYIDGELSPEKIHSFEDHLRTCAKCRHVLEKKREERRLRLSALIPNEVPLSTEEILSAVQDKRPINDSAEVIAFPRENGWRDRLKALVFHPAPAIAFALCLIALGLSLFLPFGVQKSREEPGIVIEQIESSDSVMIFQPERTNTTLIWIVPADENQEAT